ncbi:MAG TPA: 3'(2'),5'-bisphosphate nucleotidase [Gammaproteobacteria bacterium]|jgi:3'(2'), 5'-bisphosphate nucleotidase|nr:3'(2'),5'-bisphosphate nucleotidase [Gammaproteobacteria bacterium]
MVFDEPQIEQLTFQALELARKAGERIIEVYESDYEITTKADDTPLTTADLEAHRIIVEGLRVLGLDIPILSEESCGVPFSERYDWNTYWLVDPLDGTREFIKRSGEFSVNIGLIQDGAPILGVVYAPVLKVAYYAAAGFGAWKQAGDDAPIQIHVRETPADKVTVARSRSPVTGPNMQQFLQRLGNYDEVAMGSALKSCLVAEGAADVYARLGPTSEWDTGAAQCIVKEAGGKITDIRMRELRYNTRESLINPHFLVFGSEKERDWSQYLPPDLSEFSR